VGLPKAREMIYFGRRLSADEALKAGLVDRVFANAQFRSGVEEFASRLAKRAPLSVKFAKQALNMAYGASTDLGQHFEAGAFSMLLSTQDASEGISAFLSKKEPEFKGE
jgi:enoyl-CoA hydratase/carnithine racemase